MLVCAISTFIQVTGFKFGPLKCGAGILSVMGVSFASVGIWTDAINTMKVRAGVMQTTNNICVKNACLAFGEV